MIAIGKAEKGKNKMKRWCDLTVTTALAALLLSGCGSAQNAVTSTQAPTQAQPASATDVAVVETETPQPEETPEVEETPALPEHEAGMRRGSIPTPAGPTRLST